MVEQPIEVFIRHVPGDADTARQLARALLRFDIDTRGDDSLGTTDPFKAPNAIFDRAQVVLVLWSKASATDRLLVQDATEAGDRLISVSLDSPNLVPAGLRRTPTLDFRGWQGDPNDSGIDDLVAQIRARTGHGPSGASKVEVAAITAALSGASNILSASLGIDDIESRLSRFSESSDVNDLISEEEATRNPALNELRELIYAFLATSSDDSTLAPALAELTASLAAAAEDTSDSEDPTESSPSESEPVHAAPSVPDAVTWHDLDEHAQRAFEFALGCTSPDREVSRRPTVTTERLLVGILEAEQGTPEHVLTDLLTFLRITPVRLRSALREASRQRGFDPDTTSRVELDALPKSTSNVARSLASAASSIAGDSQRITLRVLLGGVLVNHTGIAFRTLDRIAGRRHDLEEIGRLYAGAFLRDRSAQTLLAFLRSAAQGPQLQGGFASELIARDVPVVDDLGVDVYVSMLANLIADPSTPMPVSIGLFGEWGAGKSHFMRLLEQSVTDAAMPLGSEVVQLWFNAWTYSDTNLWASLAAEFFEQLAGPQPDGGDERQEEIRKELQETMQLRNELQETTRQAEVETARLRGDLASARLDRETCSRALDAEVAGRIASDPEIKRLATEAAGKLGLDKDVDSIITLVHQLDGARDDLTALRSTVSRRSWRYAIPFAFVAASLIGLAIIGPRSWFDGLRGGAVVAVGAAITQIVALVARARKALGNIRAIAAREQSLRDQPSETELDLTKKLDQATTDERALNVRLERVVAKMAELDRELVELSPGRRLYRFILERAGSSDYRSQLGVVSLVRRDFEQLVGLMHRWRQERAAGSDLNEDELPPRPFDRIVLYIDDLDRCEPKQVVAVLQAVHLLLAMELFIVVVGVDPRWLLRCLQDQYAGLLTLTGTNGDENGDRPADGLSISTPQDYLEKIFQIPFALPTMDPGDLARLVAAMATTTSVAPTGERLAVAAREGEPDTSDPVEKASAPNDPIVVPAVAGVSTEPRLQVEQGSELLTDARVSGSAERTPLSSTELTLLSALNDFVNTPREAKRLFNIYRLLRSTRDLTDASRFLGDRQRPGEYQAVVQLLGLLTAFPQQLAAMMWGDLEDAAEQPVALCRTPNAGSWKAFVASLEPHRLKGDSWRNAVASPIADRDVGTWQSLVARLQRLERTVTLDDLEAYREWAPHVARFSFLLSPFASDLPDAAPPGSSA